MSTKAPAAKPPGPRQSRPAPKPPARGLLSWLLTLGFWAVGLAVAGLLSILMVVGLAMVMAYPNLPDITDMADYKPKLPLRVFTADGQLMGEFGEERRNLTPIKDIPQVMKDAVLSIEDNRFYQHGGVDYLGILRAG